MSEENKFLKLSRLEHTTHCVVVASGPSLNDTEPFVKTAYSKGWYIIAVQDAVYKVPYADALYGCDAKWWDYHGNRVNTKFFGDKYTTHDEGTNKKIEQAEKFGIKMIRGRAGDGFSTDPNYLHYGSNSGFQSINLAILLGATDIGLIGFDHRRVDGKQHFFGEHPQGWGAGEFKQWMPEWRKAAKMMPEGVRVRNCTPGSALEAFEHRSPNVLKNPPTARIP